VADPRGWGHVPLTKTQISRVHWHDVLVLTVDVLHLFKSICMLVFSFGVETTLT